jgi:fluoride ion exporter CrcB/FEX
VNTSDSTAPTIPNGSGAAAMLAAAIGSFVLAIIAFAADKSVPIKNSLNFYKPTGPLSGVTTVATVVWFLAWGLLEWRWGKRNVAMSRIKRVSLALLVLSILLTFPPMVDLL